MNLEKKFKLAYKKLKSAENVLLVGHISPDPDAISSISAILEFLKNNNIASYSYADNKLSGAYDFIPHEELISTKKPDDLSSFSVILILDCGSISRTNLEDEIKSVIKEKEEKGSFKPFIIEMDHHQPQDNFADLEIRLPDRASTTEVIYDFFQANRIEINKIMADSILIGLMSDTGNFVHPNSSFQALEISSKMLLRGASLKKISSKIRGVSLPSLKVWGRALYKLKFDSKTKFACTALSQKDLIDLGVLKHRSEIADVFGDIVSFISHLPGVNVALLLREEENKVKGSLRANNGNIDVSQIASIFGGGGHKRAAGFSVSGSLKETKEGWRVIKE